MERIGGTDGAVDFLPAGVEENVKPLVSADFVVIIAFWADLQICLEFLFPQRFFATQAFDPESFGDDTPVLHGLERLLLTLKPCHKSVNKSRKRGVKAKRYLKS